MSLRRKITIAAAMITLVCVVVSIVIAIVCQPTQLLGLRWVLRWITAVCVVVLNLGILLHWTAPTPARLTVSDQ